MIGQNTWSYQPYEPYFHEAGHPYICRVVPEKNSIHLEWLKEGKEETEANYTIYYRERGTEEFAVAGTTKQNEYDITGLCDDQEYEFYVAFCTKNQSGQSRIRLARCAEHVGTVVNYLHPEDNAYAFSGRFLCSPSYLRHPDGYLLSSMDLFQGDAPQNLTLIFRSDDEGATWHYQCELMPCFWGKMFLYQGKVYMLGCSTEYGDLLIGCSEDGGKSFGAPVTLLRGSNGKNGNVGVHKNPQNLFSYGGRLYETLEWGSWANKEYYHAAMVMSIREGDDPLVPGNWHFSAPVKYDPAWPGTAVGNSRGLIEGTLCVAPDGKLYNVMRYNITGCKPSYGLALAFRVNTEDPDAPLIFDHIFPFPGNHAKFMIKYDEESQRYYSIVSRVDCAERCYARNLLSLISSADMQHWSLVEDLINYRDYPQQDYGFQYVDFSFEGTDIVYLCRTAMNHPDNYHNSNYQTFHRIKDFRSKVNPEVPVFQRPEE